MRKLAILFLLMQPLIFPSYASAQATQGAGPQTPLSRMPNVDTRVSLVEAALQLAPEQEKYWPALEQAIRARVAGRQKRIEKLKELDQAPPDTIDLVRLRADNLSQRGAELSKLADAWQPLWQSLSDDQKTRMEILAGVVLGLTIKAAQMRRAELQEEDGGYE